MPILNTVGSNVGAKPLTPTTGAKKIFQAVFWTQSGSNGGDEDTPKIRVSDMISKMSFFYEKLRNSVDYREDSLLRKEAIYRILRRQIIIEGVLTGATELDPIKISKTLLFELIRGSYLPNNKLPEEKIHEIAVIVNKYLVLRHEIIVRMKEGRQSFNFNIIEKVKGKKTKDGSDLNDWIIGLASSEVEENLSSNQATETTVAVMYDVLLKNVKLPPELPYERDLPIQIYLGIFRNYLKLDDTEILSYLLFKYFNEDWNDPTAETIERITDRLDELKTAIDYQLNHPLMGQLNKIVHQYTVYFTVIGDTIEKNPKGVYEEMIRDPKLFTRKIKETAEKRMAEAKKKLWRSAVRSIIYIFLTKSVLVFILEVPANKFFGEVPSIASLLINICIPAFVLFVSVLFTRLPGEANTNKIIAGVEEVVFVEKTRKQPVMLKMPTKRGSVMNAIFTIIYSATFLLVFYGIVWFLELIKFSWVSVIIFIFFLAFVSFFVVRIRRNISYWIVVESKENIFTLLWSFVSVPIMATGKFLSGKFSKLNVFIFIFDFILEAPFKVLVTIAEEWTKYLKERRDSIT